MESGYYRAPIDFASIIPSEPAVESLDQAVTALREHLSRRGSDITELEEEIDNVRVETARLMEASLSFDSEIARVRRSIKRARRNVRRVDRRIQPSQKRLEWEKTQAGLYRAQRAAIQREIGISSTKSIFTIDFMPLKPYFHGTTKRSGAPF